MVDRSGCVFDSVIVSGGDGKNSADWADTFLRDIHQGFQALGLESVHLRQNETTRHLLAQIGRDWFARGKTFFLFDLNAKIPVLTRPGTGPLPRFSLIVDHPWSQAHLTGFHERNLLGVVDRGYVGVPGYGRVRRVFLPHGGPPAPDEPITGDRPIDVVFSGNIIMDTALPPAEYAEGDAVVKTIVTDAVERIVEGGAEPGAGLCQALEKSGFAIAALDAKTAETLVNIVSGYSQSVFRERVLNGLRGLRVCLVGHVCERLGRQLPETFFQETYRTFTDVRALFRQSKIALNIAHKFPDGAHERIWYGMANGCAVLTNTTPYLRESFVEDESMLFYQRCDLDTRKIAEFVKSGKTGAIAQAALPIYRAQHTWTHRAQTVVGTMNAVWPDARAALQTLFQV